MDAPEVSLSGPKAEKCLLRTQGGGIEDGFERNRGKWRNRYLWLKLEIEFWQCQ